MRYRVRKNHRQCNSILGRPLRRLRHKVILDIAVAAGVPGTPKPREGGSPANEQPTRLPLQILRAPYVAACTAALACLLAIHLHAAEVIPPKPPGYFQDNAGVVSKSTALR